MEALRRWSGGGGDWHCPPARPNVGGVVGVLGLVAGFVLLLAAFVGAAVWLFAALARVVM